MNATAGSGKRITVKDVARAAGVSAGTVSNAISGKRKVDAETRARIDMAIRDLGYVPNLAARGMRTGRANTVAVFSSMPTSVAAGQSRLGFLMEIAASAAVTALEHDLALVLVPPIERPDSALATIPFDGAILVEPEPDDAYWALLRARGVPTVMIGPPEGTEVPCVAFDYAGMAELLIDHLVAAGARDFPLVLGRSARASNAIFRRVHAARMAALGLPCRVIDIAETEALAGARDAVAAEIAAGRGMDGVLVPIDAMATGVMAGLRDAGLKVPRDVVVATRYDGLRARSEVPALTALDLGLETVARQATEMLVGLLGAADARVVEAPAPRLIPRGSSLRR